MVAKSSKPPSEIHIVSNRLQTFSKPVKVSKSTKLRWPHKKPSAEDLALAGFYYFPYEGADDNVCCFLCGKNMGGWEPTDDPLQEHLRGNKGCAFAVLRDLLVKSMNGEDYGNDVLDPRSEEMNELREETFGKWWPHDDKKGWNPKSKKMAKAGFYYTPTHDSDDMVNCPYCLIGLDGWEPKDDPMKEHKTRTPLCPFFVGLSTSAPTSNTSSPTKQVSEPSASRSLRKQDVDHEEDSPPPKQTKGKRRLTRQVEQDDYQEPISDVDSPPPAKRRKSTRVPSQTDTSKASPGATTKVSEGSPKNRKSRRITRNPPKPRKSSIATKETPIESADEEEADAPIANRRVTRSGLSFPPIQDIPDELEPEPEPEPEPPVVENTTPVKAKGKAVRGKSRQVSALSKIVSEIDKTAPERTSRSRQSIVQPPVEVDSISESVEEPKEPSPPPKKKRGRQTKVRPSDVVEDIAPPKPTTRRRTKQSVVPEPGVDEVESVEEEPVKPPKPIVIPKRKRASTRANVSTSTISETLPDIQETESTSSATKPDPLETVESEVVPAPAPTRGRKPTQGRGRRTTTRQSTIPETAEIVTITEEPAKPRRGRVSKRDISAVYNDTAEEDKSLPTTKRKVKSSQKLPTPPEDSDSDVFEDSKSTFSEPEEIIVPVKKGRRGRSTFQNASQRGRKPLSEDRETEVSTIYHSADDYHSSPAHDGVGTGKSKREVVDNAKKELEEEIWREKVASGEITVGASSEDDEKENAAEEKGKKPTRTVRGKGAKGRKLKASLMKKAKETITETEEEDASSAGEGHAMMIKAMISPAKPGPVVPEQESDENTDEEVAVNGVNGTVTPVNAPKRKALNWTPAKIEDVEPAPKPNGSLTEEEEDMTVEQWMRFVINDEVNRLQEECEKLVKNLEREGERARRRLESLI